MKRKLTFAEKRRLVRERQIERYVSAWSGAGQDGNLWLLVMLALVCFALVVFTR